MVRGALFKRIEEEKGLGGWAPAPRRGIRTVGITDSAITGPRQLGPARHLHRRRLPCGRRPVSRRRASLPAAQAARRARSGSTAQEAITRCDRGVNANRRYACHSARFTRACIRCRMVYLRAVGDGPDTGPHAQRKPMANRRRAIPGARRRERPELDDLSTEAPSHRRTNNRQGECG